MAIFRPLVGVSTKNQYSLRSRDDFCLFPNNRKHRASGSKLRGQLGKAGLGTARVILLHFVGHLHARVTFGN